MPTSLFRFPSRPPNPCPARAALVLTSVLAFLVLGAGSVVGADKPTTRAFRLVERFRVDDTSSEHVLGNIRKVVADAEGRIFLLDDQVKHLLVFAGDGTYLGAWSDEGDGPGEFREATDLVVGPEGQIGICLGFPGRIDFLDRTGEPWGRRIRPLEDLRADGALYAVLAAQINGERLVTLNQILSKEPGVEDFQLKLVVSRLDGTREKLIWEKFTTVSVNFFRETDDYRVFQFGWETIADRVFLAPERNDYHIEVFDLEGRSVGTIIRDVEGRKRTAEDIARLTSHMEKIKRRNPNFQWSLEERARPIREIHSFGNREVWVEVNREPDTLPPNALCVLDAYDLDGNSLGTVQLLCEEDRFQGRLFILGEDRLAMHTSQIPLGESAADHDEEPSVIIYDLVPAAP